MLKPTDRQTAAGLYVHERTINWGDTDSARIVYTAQFTDFSLEAIEGWYRAVVGTDWYEMNIKRNLHTPFVHIDMDLKAMLTPQNNPILFIRPRRQGLCRHSSAQEVNPGRGRNRPAANG